jgi:hypothetical protein
MTTHLSVETISDDNQKSLFKSKRVKLSGKEAITPLRALDPSKFRTDIALNKKAFGLNEVYRSLDSEKIAALRKDSNEHDIFASVLANHVKRSQPNDLNLCVIRYSSKNPNPLPTTKEIEFVTDVAHSFSDITPLPIINIEIDASNFVRYLDCLKTCYDTIEELNHKPIMGVIPNLPPELYSKLLDFYLKKDITSFYVDFDGKTPNHLKLRPILRFLNTKGMLGKSLIYGINAKPGMVLKNTNVIPSKDFIAYGYGIDALGESHVGAKRPKEFWEKMKKAVDTQQPNKKRIFIKTDYGYYKTSAKEDVSGLYPNDTRIKLDNIINDTQNNWQKLFNMEQQAIEAETIRRRLNSLDKNETILDYIKKKTQIQKELKHLESGPKDISQQMLV